nr:RNA-directed DNA polymerase, eukaryota [Tanacetum cinerariifolium]
MGDWCSHPSKEDLTQKISTSVRSRTGLRFGFVRFIQVKDVDRLVGNLCAIWVDRHRLHVNVARFQRPSLKNVSNGNRFNEKTKLHTGGSNRGYDGIDKGISYAGVVKQKGNANAFEVGNQPSIVIDDSYIRRGDLSLSLMEKVKDFGLLTNLKRILVKEAFDKLKLKYMGGFWIMIEFDSLSVLDKFKAHVGVGSWFLDLQMASYQFFIYSRVTWVDIEGVPLKAWTTNTFSKISSECGTFLYEEDNENLFLKNKRVCINTTLVKTIFGSFKIIVKGKSFWGRAKEENANTKEDQELHFADPFNIYGLLNKNQHSDKKDSVESVDTMKFPSGFTPKDNGIDNNDVEDQILRGENFNSQKTMDEKSFPKTSNSNTKMSSKVEGNVSCCSGHFRQTEDPPTGGSVLQLLEDVMKVGSCPNISTIALDHFLSDHRPILLREVCLDYGPIPFWFHHYWFDWEDFDKFVLDSWNELSIHDSNAISEFMKKLKCLKEKIQLWTKMKKESSKLQKMKLKKELSDMDILIDNKCANQEIINKRSQVMHFLQDLEKLESMEVAQKVKIKWSIEGDENSKYYHGLLNKSINQLSIRGVLSDGAWVESPAVVKNEFLTHFRNRFERPKASRLVLDTNFPLKLDSDQKEDLERMVSKEEIKSAVWDCCVDKSPSLDGFTFGFYKRYWSMLESDVVDAVSYFFNHDKFPKGGNSSFIALIPKLQDAKLVKDFRPISLIGSLYKIIAKVLLNRLVGVLKGLVNEVQSAFVSDRQSLNGQWREANIDIIVNALKCFHLASGLRMNLHKSKLMGIAIENDKIARAANKIGCLTLKNPFSYLGIKVGGLMSRVNSWDKVVDSLYARVYKWKMKTLSIGGRLTLLKSVLGSMPIYYMSLFKVSSQVLKKMEAIRSHFLMGLRLMRTKCVGLNGIADGKLRKNVNRSHPSIWLDIVNEVHNLKIKNLDILSLMKKKIGNGSDTPFWEETWRGDHSFSTGFPRIFALEDDKSITVARKMAHDDLTFSLRRNPRDGAEAMQFSKLKAILDG